LIDVARQRARPGCGLTPRDETAAH
jgi:hypothetical protein